jgi:AmmeMemoRadiSam system protein A
MFAGFHRLIEERGSFVTLKEHNQLRGCIGNILARQPLYMSVRDNAISAAIRDPRFRPVTEEELSDLIVSVSVLEVPQLFQVNSPDEYLERLTHQDGVLLLNNGRSVIYLPQVWEELPEPEDFLSRLCLKAGTSAECWCDPQRQLYTYRAQEFGEEY